MVQKKIRTIQFPLKLLIAGISLIIIGGLLLLWNLGYLPFLGLLWPLPFMVVGIFLLYQVFVKKKGDWYIFPGMLFSLGGLFFLLLNTIMQRSGLIMIWPVFMSITGLSLIPYALKRRRRHRIDLLISSIFIVLLSLMFLPFSLKRTGITFFQFVLKWWPLLLIIAGSSLIISLIIRKKPTK
jgi:hypothetical protein